MISFDVILESNEDVGVRNEFKNEKIKIKRRGKNQRFISVE